MALSLRERFGRGTGQTNIHLPCAGNAGAIESVHPLNCRRRYQKMNKPFARLMQPSLILVILFCSSCAPKDDIKKTEAEIARFHERWNQWDFTGIYNDADPAFRAAQDAQKTIGQFQTSRRLYGAFKSATQKTVNVTSAQSKKEISFKFDSVYEHIAAIESFSYRMTGGKPLLVEYYVLPPERAAEYEAEQAKRKAKH